MGIQILGPTYVYGDNQSVLYNTTIPESTLKKKSQSLCYHFVREGVARNEWRTGYVKSLDNPADLLTKPLTATKRAHLLRSILHHIYDDENISNQGLLIATWQEPEVTVLTAWIPPALFLPHFRCSYNGVLFRGTRYENRLD